MKRFLVDKVLRFWIDDQPHDADHAVSGHDREFESGAADNRHQSNYKLRLFLYCLLCNFMHSTNLVYFFA